MLDEASGRYTVAPPTTAVLAAEARRVSLLSRPAPATFAQLPGDAWVADPCAAEEELGAVVSLCLVGDSWSVYHQGGGGANVDRFLSELMPAARALAPGTVAILGEPPDGTRGTAAAAAGSPGQGGGEKEGRWVRRRREQGAAVASAT